MYVNVEVFFSHTVRIAPCDIQDERKVHFCIVIKIKVRSKGRGVAHLGQIKLNIFLLYFNANHALSTLSLNAFMSIHMPLKRTSLEFCND